MFRPALQGCAIGLVAALLAGTLWWSGGLTPLENLTWKWRVGWFAAPPRTPVVLIALDQQSLDWGAQENGLAWPWPREAYGLILDFCRRAGARAVALDLVFSEPSASGPADDRAFSEALARAPVVGGMTLTRPVSPSAPIKLFGRKRLRFSGKLPSTLNYSGATFPIAELADAFTMTGNVTAMPDADGVYRRIPLVNAVGTEAIPSLALALYLVDHDLPVSFSPDQLRIGAAEIPLDAGGAAILHFRGPSATFPTFSAAAIIQSELRLREGGVSPLDPAQLKDAYVLFGLTAPGLYDLRPTPIDGVFPGMEIHATALDNLLTNAFLRDAPLLWGGLLTLGLAMVTGTLIRYSNRAWQALAVASLILPLPVFAAGLAYQTGWWLPVAVPGSAALLALGIGLLVNYAVEGKQRRFIKRAFNQYLHPTVIEQLVAHPERLRLGGERRELSIFFSDLQGFTSLAETLDPETLTSFLNEYLTAMTDILLDSGGTIDKYEGDAIIAFWNAPLDQSDHAERAVRAALACQERLAELRPGFKARIGSELYMRIGINTGPAVVGNLGSQRRFDYTMLGDAVNLAARLEGVNKEFGTYTLISEATQRQLGKNFALREIATVGVVGRKVAVRIFEPWSSDEPATEFNEALQLYYAGDFVDAAVRFSRLGESDRTAGIYAEQCLRLAAAPPQVWDGVWRLVNK